MNKNQKETREVEAKKVNQKKTIDIMIYSEANLKECTHFPFEELKFINKQLIIKAMDTCRKEMEEPEKAKDRELLSLLKGLSPDQLATIQKMSIKDNIPAQ